MNNQPSWLLIGLVGLLMVCCVAASIGTLALFMLSPDIPSAFSLAPPPALTLTSFQSPTPKPSATKQATPSKKPSASGSSSARATRTPVATRTPLPVKNITYSIVVPTPVAPQTTYDINFDSNLTVQTYTVRGTTLNALSASLDANALADPHEDKSRYYARTDWHLGGNWYWKPTPRGCEVDHGEVTMQMTMTLPILAQQTGVPTSVQTRWNRFIDNTITHESGHVKISLQGARDYQRDLGNSSAAADCGVLKARLQDLFDRAFSSIDDANVRYDAETKHGVNQGAVFP